MAGLIILGLIALFAEIWPDAVDFQTAYYPVARDWLHGDMKLYDSTKYDFYNLPWMMVLLVPLALLPVSVAQAVVVVGSMLIILTSIHLFRQVAPIPGWLVLLAIANLHTFDLLIRGQIDAVQLAGIMLGWIALRKHRPYWLGVALALLATKPLNVALTGLLFLIELRTWPRADWIKVLGLPVLLLALSPLIAGWHWPWDYVTAMRENPPSAHRSFSIWRTAPEQGWPIWPFAVIALIAVLGWLRIAWRDGLTNRTLCIALTTNLAVGTYINGYHCILLVPALVLVGSKNRWLALLAYLATWTPLLRVNNPTFTLADILYPVTLLVALWMIADPAQPISRKE